MVKIKRKQFGTQRWMKKEKKWQEKKIKLVWKEAYKRLGDLNLEKEDFDNEFADEVDKEVEETNTMMN